MKQWALILALILMTISNGYAGTAKADILGTDPGSTVNGTALLNDTTDGLEVRIIIHGAPAGTHGIHFHEKGSCDEGGDAAGGHYNPDSMKHGDVVKNGVAGAHAGDLGNIEIGADGKGSLNLVIPDLTVSGGRYNVTDRAVILHEKEDDFGQPTGNAGGRIGCGVIEGA
jgi:Cu-Zn family superoxide dismutase